MRLTARLLLLLLPWVAAPFAGCVNVEPLPLDEALAPDAVAGDVIHWNAKGCDAALGLVPVPAEALAPHLPDGFRPVSPTELGLPDDPRGDALFAMEAFRCATYDADGKVVRDAPIGGFFTFVEPPEHLKEDASLYFFRWDSLVPDADLTATLAGAGFPMRNGDATVTTDLPTGTGKGPIQARLDLDDEVYGFNGVANGDWTDPLTGNFTEWTLTESGAYGVWRADYNWHEISTGAGYLKLAPGGFPMDVIGMERAPAYFIWGHFDFGGTITLPPAA